MKRPQDDPSAKAEAKRLAPMMKALKAIHSAASPESMSPDDLERQRKGQELLGRLVTPMVGMSWEPFDLSGMAAAWVRPDRGHDRRHAVLYCHGGGYTSGNLGYSRPIASKLAGVTGFEVLSFEYRLAPEHPYPAAVEDALKAWDYLMYLGYGARDIVVAGDSAGGNLALVLAHRLKATGRRLPGALILMSPWTDMTASGRSYQERAELDPSLTQDYIQAVRAAYAGGEDWTAPGLSPLFGDLRGFPPVLIQAGTNEILLSDSVRLRDRLVAAGVPCRLEVWRGMWHVFQMFPIKRASEAMDSIGRFLLEQLCI
ncbi:alpha/beta hydrolase [Pseudoflavonifractor sp. MSJ-37]|uniref:alpha/beta hydrolase n=1 Tax=Pseudoflavonifractor sp. MSJ-37 TaxID=2841531 RepID=UPI001C0F3F6F|nr:alpha/beta hydrolase [Pseudoflavonifractor sp. MSJ-37]MBU5434954.1 alpha/beta hydrolase [Pseudoflavonifractor sp. MSJ-37]